MKLPAAVGLGAIAAFALPYVLRHVSGSLGDMVRHSNRMIQMGGLEIHFSLTIFAIVTVFSWAFFVWSDR